MFTQLSPRNLLLAAALLVVAQLVSAQQKPVEKRHLVELNTTVGRMVVELYNETPIHRDNFLKLVNEHYYDSTLFYRVVPDFMIQGGDAASKRAADRTKPVGGDGPGYTLPAEIRPDLIHRKGALATAGADDDAGPEKRGSGSRFFIVEGRTWQPADLQQLQDRLNAARPDSSAIHYTSDQTETYKTLGGSPHLDGGYTVFGQVVSGMDVLDRIIAQPCDEFDRPVADIRVWMHVLQ